ncbi:CIC11C00000003693 [Sungouiella intermedia]|uniref:Golgi to ER traffic protein 1 n=1 Tax=Sungouiella intermedia TaxID=45354 RepID=A0A1L0BMP8_9ASCO|nr:CIC11C00000001906 [[Candida] intermedia]SGZ52663.1 CIC11C00000003693 [[Candida] intermedia]
MFDLQSSTILIAIFLVLVTKHIVNLIGKSNIQNQAWNVYTQVASKAGHPKFAELSAKRKQLLEINKERKSISAQDQYAKWTKLNRQFDTVSAEVKALGDQMSVEKALFSKYVGYAITAVTTAPIWFSRYKYRKNVLFYFPPGVLPSKVEWFLALPFMKSGAVGLTIWMFAVNSVLSSVESLVRFILMPRVEKPVRPPPKVSEVEEVNQTFQVPVDLD